jgi:hypothetical protein
MLLAYALLPLGVLGALAGIYLGGFYSGSRLKMSGSEFSKSIL